ncbi:hypothetical protein SAMN05421720_107129 [Rhodospira trueperi]|uniref:Uncharacterized protein n=1 Tax=Rhodospira trueperi TaxID=69960 RepID=A0A1G7DCK1_9PROT|nr:hypothetical protein SAMN05421720_107129 [Rhodospira trueperi]
MTTRTSTVPMRQLGNGFAASAISFGAMGVSEFWVFGLIG